MPCPLSQVDSSPDRPAPGEIREKEAPTPSKASSGTPIDGMIIGANVNSYLRRGAEFDVMRNVEAGVEDAGAGAAGFAAEDVQQGRERSSVSVP